MEYAKLVSAPMLQLIKFSIDNARSFLDDMRKDMEEEELESMTIKQFRNQLIDQAMEFFGNELNPDTGADCPKFIAEVIQELVNKMTINQVMDYRAAF